MSDPTIPQPQPEPSPGPHASFPPVPPAARPPWQQYDPGGYMQPRQRNGMGVAALVLGIVGAAMSLIPFLFWVAWIPSLLALIFGLIGAKRAKRREADNRGVAIWGWILGLVGLVISTIFLIVFLSAVDSAVDAYDHDQETADLIEDTWGEGSAWDAYNDCIDDAMPNPSDADWARCEDLLEVN